MSLKLITPPTSEPVSLEEAKLFLRVDGTEDDALIGSLVTAVRLAAEHETGRALCVQSWERAMYCFPAGAIKLAKAPVASVDAVIYTDAAGVEKTLDDATYVLDAADEPGWLRPAYGQDWPDTLDDANAVRVQFTCGYAEAGEPNECPKSIVSWILLHVANLYKNRETVAVGQTVATMPFVAGLLDPYRVYA